MVLAFAAGGKLFPKVELQVTKQTASGVAPTYFALYMENVVVASVALSGGDDGQVVQSVTLAFKSIRIDYKAQDPKSGMPGTGKQFNWDVATNQSGNS